MRVFIVGGDHGIERMWLGRGHHIVDKQEDADVIQFIGGADVNPELYGEEPHEKTSCSHYADKRDMEVWRSSKPNQLKIGICRGGQFLNVVNGGAMWQHIDGHQTWQGHFMRDLFSGKEIRVSSTHHQMMIPSEKAELIAFAQGIAKNHSTRKLDGRLQPKVDVEVIWYYDTKSLCFQPHPEHNNFLDCRNYYFNLVERLYEPKKGN